MSSMSSLGIAVSGLNAAQTGLSVTGHNLSNVHTTGYSRQRVLQSDFLYRNIGSNAGGLMQLGLGTNTTPIQQIRNKFFDISYRAEIPKASFHSVRYITGTEMETILGEMQSDYRAQTVLRDMWDALNELAVAPDSLDTRGNFVATCVTFINKANNVFNRSFEYQQNLNQQVVESVQRINQLVIEIDKLNTTISQAEAAGDSANDYRDQRNNCLDELSTFLKIDYKENNRGVVDILAEGKELLANGNINTLGLRYTSPNCSFVEPVFTNSNTIIPYPTLDPANPNMIADFYKSFNVKPLFKLNSGFNPTTGTGDDGKLKGLLLARGIEPANYATQQRLANPPTLPNNPTALQKAQYELDKWEYDRIKFNVQNCTIPKMQQQFDTIINNTVTMINQAFAPVSQDGTKDYANAPYDLEGNQTFMEIFVRNTKDRFDANGNYIQEDPKSYFTLYSTGNIKINPLLLNSEGFSKIPTSKKGDVGDPNLILDLLGKWGSKSFMTIDGNGASVDDAYQRFVTSMAVDTNEAKRYFEGQQELVAEIDNKRMSMSAVSMDEEMSTMLRYQHAYNAAAKILNAIDSMLDRIVNKLGRVGI